MTLSTQFRKTLAAGLASVALLAAAPCLAGPLEDCAALAASPHEPGHGSSGVDQMDLDIDAAVDACTSAVEADPTEMRARAWLSRALYIGKRYPEMYPHIEMAAEAGNAVAQQLLGDALVEGRGIERDLARSFQLLQASAAQNYAPGLYSLGLSYQRGEGVAADIGKAAELFARAAEQDYRFALGDLGVMKLTGTGVDRDPAGGIALLERAAAQRDGYALLQLGLAYFESDAVPNDAAKALGYYLAADALGEAQAAAPAAFILLGESAGVEADYEKAARLARKAADAGQGAGYYVLGHMAEKGYGGPADRELARQHYAKGAELGDSFSTEALAALDR